MPDRRLMRVKAETWDAGQARRYVQAWNDGLSPSSLSARFWIPRGSQKYWARLLSEKFGLTLTRPRPQRCRE